MPTPIFVLGVQRSGNTWSANLLNRPGTGLARLVPVPVMRLVTAIVDFLSDGHWRTIADRLFRLARPENSDGRGPKFGRQIG